MVIQNQYPSPKPLDQTFYGKVYIMFGLYWNDLSKFSN